MRPRRPARTRWPSPATSPTRRRAPAGDRRGRPGLGGIDALVYATGIGPLARLADTDAETWRQVFDTNVIGASLVTAAALPHLTASSGVAAYLSSVSASLTPPWPGPRCLRRQQGGPRQLVDAWRAEHPSVGFTRVIVGDCAGGEGPSMTEFPAGLGPRAGRRDGADLGGPRYIAGALLDVEELVACVDTVLHCGASACIPVVAVVSPTAGLRAPDG